MMTMPTFTVFTPTYNRAHTLPRVYASLCAQTLRDFEWLIIDDGSTDGTGDLVAGWQGEADFPIRYIWQENGGKHVAHNRAVLEAHGRLFLPLDSDDTCAPNALERLLFHWNRIPQDRQALYAGVTGLCLDEKQHVVGDRFPQDTLDASVLDLIYRFRVHGEKWGFVRTDLVRRFPFPVLPNQRGHIPEAYVWSRIARAHLTRFVNEPLRTYYVGHPSLMTEGRSSLAGLRRLAPGAALVHRMVLNEQTAYLRSSPVAFLRSAALYSRFSFHLGYGALRQWRQLDNPSAHILLAIGMPIGALYFVKDCLRQFVRPVSTARTRP